MAKKEKASEAAKSKTASPNSLAGIPGVSSAIARSRAKGSLVGMVLAGGCAFLSGSSLYLALAWSVAGGIVAGLLTWWISVMLWRMAISAEYAGRQRELLEASQTE